VIFIFGTERSLRSFNKGRNVKNTEDEEDNINCQVNAAAHGEPFHFHTQSCGRSGLPKYTKQVSEKKGQRGLSINHRYENHRLGGESSTKDT
jgi:hypothetical protein